MLYGFATKRLTKNRKTREAALLQYRIDTTYLFCPSTFHRILELPSLAARRGTQKSFAIPVSTLSRVLRASTSPSTQELHSSFARVTTRYQAALGDDEDFEQDPTEATPQLQKWGAPEDGAGKKGPRCIAKHSETMLNPIFFVIHHGNLSHVKENENTKEASL